jgi:hypothetical protein
MKPATPTERRDALRSFTAYDEPTLEVVGRSELENWSLCPAMASLIEQGKGGPLPGYVATGELVHQAIGKTVQTWIDTAGEIGPKGIRETLEQALRGTRPDLQPQVIAACRPSLWSFAAFLSEVNPGNILHFDGGEGERSGVLAMDLPSAGVRYCGEMDLLWAGPARGVLQLEDYKSGYRYFRGWDVLASFQFQSYAVLIFENYPDVQAVECRVWNTRQNTKTYPVMFERAKLDNYLARIHAALQSRYDHREKPEPWPTEEKCGRCPVAMHCPASGDVGMVAADPVAALNNYIALGEKYAAAGKVLTAHVKAHGPIEGDGVRFAAEHKSKPRPQLIAAKTQEKPDDSDGDTD